MALPAVMRVMIVGALMSARAKGEGAGGGKQQTGHIRSPVDSGIVIGQSPAMSDPELPEKDRADRMLVALGHFGSRAAAQAAITAGHVTADGRKIARASESLSRDAVITAEAAHPYVSRGGLKLAHALDTFGVDPAGLICLDLGASTGGFTDVLLSRGAAVIIAIDVGHGQLRKIAADRASPPRTHQCPRSHTGTPRAAPRLIVSDLSFVSLEKFSASPALAAQKATLIALFKPQFESRPGKCRQGRHRHG